MQQSQAWLHVCVHAALRAELGVSKQGREGLDHGKVFACHAEACKASFATLQHAVNLGLRINANVVDKICNEGVQACNAESHATQFQDTEDVEQKVAQVTHALHARQAIIMLHAS